jgi:YhcH/YjgK/YiaL family protein
MIVTDFAHVARQAALTPRFHRALFFLQNTDLAALADGRVDIDGSAVYALVQSYTTRPEADAPRFEAHRRYADIQVVVAGDEFIGWAAIEALEAGTEYSEEKDIIRGTVAAGAFTLTRLHAGQLAILYPEDAHAPMLAVGAPAPVKKVVVKVLL